MVTDPGSRPPLRTSFWPRDESVPPAELTVGGLLAERARPHAVI